MVRYTVLDGIPDFFWGIDCIVLLLLVAFACILSIFRFYVEWGGLEVAGCLLFLFFILLSFSS